MHISILQAILIGLLYYITVANSPWFTGLASVSIRQPIVAGTIVGCILGDPVKGLVIGATINTLFLGFISAGGTVASEPGIAGIVGTALTIITGASPAIALSLAVPFGLVGTLLWNVRMTGNSYFVHKLDKVAETGDVRKMMFIQLVPAQIACLILTAVPVALIVYFGGSAMNGILATLTGTPLQILKVIGGILPALGIAMTLRMLSNRKGIMVFFIFGFFLEVYSALPMLVLAIFGFAVAYVYSELKFKKEAE